jgi:hypothetical protein
MLEVVMMYRVGRDVLRRNENDQLQDEEEVW